MGQFFRGTAPLATRNKIYQPNFDLMGKVLGVVEGQIEKGEQELQAVDKLLKDIKYLDQDKERVNEIVGAYNKENEKYTNIVANNPLEFRKHLGNIKALGKQLSDDYTNGELGAIQGNYKTKEEYIKEQKKRIGQKDSGLTEQQLSLMLNYQDKNFKGTNWSDKTTYDKYNSESLIADPNIIKLADEMAKEYKASSKKLHTAGEKDGFITSGIEYEKGISPLELSKFVSSSLLSDNKVQNYLKQYQKIAGLSNKDVANIIQNASLLAGQKYGFIEQETGIKSISANSYSLASYQNKLKEKEDLFSSVSIPVDTRVFKDLLNPHIEKRRINSLCEISEKLNINTPMDFTKDEDVAKLQAIILSTKDKYKNDPEKYEKLVELEQFFYGVEEDYRVKSLRASNSAYLNMTNNDEKQAKAIEKSVKKISSGEITNNNMKMLLSTDEGVKKYTLGQLLNNDIKIDGVNVRLEGVKGNMSELTPLVTGEFFMSTLRFKVVDEDRYDNFEDVGREEEYITKSFLTPLQDSFPEIFESNTGYSNN